MSELDQQATEPTQGETPGKKQQPPKIRVLNLSIVLGDDDDVAEVITTATGLGQEVRSVSVNQQFDYGYDFPY